MYATLKPPKYGNCTVRDMEDKRITLGDLLKTCPVQKTTYRVGFLKELKSRLDNIIQTCEWDQSEHIIAEMTDSSLNEVQDSIVYYLTGYVSRQMYKKYNSCETCKNVFSSCYENIVFGCQQADLVNVKSRGGLIHPNMHLFSLFSKLERHFEEHTKNGTSKFLYNEIVDDFFNENSSLSFTCEKHKESVIAYSIHYYIQMRMCQYSRQINRDSTKLSQHKKKLSKHQKK